LSGGNGFKEVFNDEVALATFMRSLRSFEDCLCRSLESQTDFTLKFEVRGNHGRMVHCRIDTLQYDRPDEKTPN